MDPRVVTASARIALLVAMLAMLLLTALGAAVLLTTSSETIIAANFREQHGGALRGGRGPRARDGRVCRRRRTGTRCSTASTPSAFADGAPGGVRTLADGTTIDLGQVVNLANCQKVTPCSDADMDAVSADRPWGSLNPRWVLCGYGPLSGVLPAGGTVNSPPAMSSFWSDRPLDPASPADRRTRSAMRAEAFGPRGAHKVVEATVARTDAGVRMLAWRTVR